LWPVQPEFGQTCLHLAVKRGDVEMVEQLLRYKADPEIKNRLGYYPIHYAWSFWKKTNMVDERLTQEDRTVKVLSVLCSFSTVPDKQQEVDGSTPMHLAAKHGPTYAAITLMGFKAKHDMLNKEGETPLDIAVRYSRPEIARIIRIWDQIHHQMIHADFVVLWNKFISDYDAVISDTKSAEKIIFELQMVIIYHFHDFENHLFHMPGLFSPFYLLYLARWDQKVRTRGIYESYVHLGYIFEIVFPLPRLNMTSC